jgi:phosphocarrier protein
VVKKKQITIINKLGLHARAAAKLVQTASKYKSDITISCKDKESNGKSIMGIMMLAASKDNTVEVTAVGKDEEKAVAAIEALITNRFDEKE